MKYFLSTAVTQDFFVSVAIQLRELLVGHCIPLWFPVALCFYTVHVFVLTDYPCTGPISRVLLCGCHLPGFLLPAQLNPCHCRHVL